ncbi:MAG TPA: DUF58 domain-containing protein [Capsulimonadaceae bacterium]
MPNTNLLDPAFMRKLEKLTLVARKVYHGQLHGERRTTRRGHSVEFADFREYAAGDDLRYVDWKAFARLDKLFLKLFRAEEDLTVHFLVDVSKSMSFGAPMTKVEYAVRVCAALGYIGLNEYDRITVTTFNDELHARLPGLRGRTSVPSFFRYLERLSEGGGRTDFATALRLYAERETTAGLAVVCSDFFDANVRSGIHALLARRFQVVLIQILDPDEVTPSIAGDVRLVDAETGDHLQLSVSPYTLGEYQRRFDEFVGELELLASRHGMEYVRVTTETPFEDTVLKYLYSGGLVR